MDCTICGKQVVNENNRLQKKVKDFLKTINELDLKQRWIQQWKICYDCSETYTNDMLVSSSEVQQKIEEQKNRKKQQVKVLHREPLQAVRAYYIEKYIDYATEKVEQKSVNEAKPPYLKIVTHTMQPILHMWNAVNRLQC